MAGNHSGSLIYTHLWTHTYSGLLSPGISFELTKTLISSCEYNFPFIRVSYKSGHGYNLRSRENITNIVKRTKIEDFKLNKLYIND